MERKGQNSALLIACLGVYLGLLMAGATPAVLAQQAAMARQFDLKDEIEFSENLDKDPNDFPPIKSASKPLTSKSVDDFPTAFTDYIRQDLEERLNRSKRLSAECPGSCRISYLTYFPTIAPQLETIFGTSDHRWTNENSNTTEFYGLEVNFHSSVAETQRFQAEFEKNLAAPDALARLVAHNSVVGLKRGHLLVRARFARADLSSEASDSDR